jgi:acyl-CoA synthetase (AMP-forming)/AMP-acid ligase II
LPIQRHLAVLPLALLLENVAGLYAPLLRGAEIILPKQADLGWRGMAGFDAIALARHVEDAQPSSLILVPELLKAWTLALEMTGRRAPAGLRFVAVGGARVDRTLLERARQTGLPAYEGYGLTECGSVVCLNRPGADRIGTVGQALDHVSIEMGDENGNANEIRIRSRAQTRVFLGYLGDAAPSREIWPTGDVGRMDEAGFLGLSGRSKSLLITAYGRNISPEWVEAALTAQPEIAQAVVVGDARPWLSAILVPAPGVDADGLA